MKASYTFRRLVEGEDEKADFEVTVMADNYRDAQSRTIALLPSSISFNDLILGRIIDDEVVNRPTFILKDDKPRGLK